MIPVKEVLASGAWLHFCSDDEIVQCRLKAVSFRKLSLSEVDNPLEIKQGTANASWWIMEVEVVSLVKRKIQPEVFIDKILLVDQDDFEFNVTKNLHLWCFSDFSDVSGLRRFFGRDLIPKTKATGAIAFLLPDDDDAEYSFSMEDGSVREA